MNSDPEIAIATQELRPYSVWLTGPEQPYQRLLNAIERAGGHSWHQAVIQIVDPAPELLAAARALWLATPPWDFCLFTSRPAVSAASKLGGAPELALLGAVGKASAEAVTAAFARPCFAPNADASAAALLEHPALAPPKVVGRRILILQGEGGRDQLDDGLRERGAAVAVARVYARAPAPINLASVQRALAGRPILSLASIAIAETLAQACRAQNSEWPLTSPVLAWSPRIGNALPKLGYQGLICSAATATPIGLFAALLDLAQRDLNQLPGAAEH